MLWFPLAVFILAAYAYFIVYHGGIEMDITPRDRLGQLEELEERRKD